MVQPKLKQKEDVNELEVQDEKKSLKEDIQSVINQRIKSITFMRGIRVLLSNRLEAYSRKWKFIFFIMNVEAIIIVLLSLTNKIETIKIGTISIDFDLISGIFTLYVILLQYFINILNYNERALRVHYHQLEIEDLRQQLTMLSLKTNAPEGNISEQEAITSYEQLVNQYQLAVKNNENHRELDFKRTSYDQQLSNYLRGKAENKPEGKRPRDFTLDIALIYANTSLSALMFFTICYVILFTSS